MKKGILGGVALFALVFPALSLADPLPDALDRYLGTLSAVFVPSYSQGHIQSCGIEFSALLRDWKYHQGGFTHVSGTFGIMTGKKSLAVVLKVVVNDVSSDLKRTPSPPETAYFIDNQFGTTAKQLLGSTKSDTPGALFSIFNSDTFKLLANQIAKGSVTFAFARKKGGSDVLVAIDTTVRNIRPDGSKQRSTEAATKFFDCAGKLAAELATQG